MVGETNEMRECCTFKKFDKEINENEIRRERKERQRIGENIIVFQKCDNKKITGEEKKGRRDKN